MPRYSAPSEGPGGGSRACADRVHVLDLERLAVQLGGDPDAAREVLRLFLKEGPENLTRMREAVTEGDAKGVEWAAHRLKGALRWITADVAAAHAESVETQARSRDLDLAPRLLDDLAREVARVIEEAREKVDPPTRSASAFGTAGPDDD